MSQHTASKKKGRGGTEAVHVNMHISDVHTHSSRALNIHIYIHPYLHTYGQTFFCTEKKSEILFAKSAGVRRRIACSFKALLRHF